MRPALLLLVLSFAVGCGRVGFAHSDANSNGSDADKTPSDAATGAPTFVQLSNPSSCTATSQCTTNFPTATTSGDLLLVVVAHTGGATVANIGDTNANFAQLIDGNWPVTDATVEVWIATTTGSTGPEQFTVNFGNNTDAAIVGVEYGHVAANPIDQTAFAGADASGSAASSGARTPSRSNEMVFGFCSVSSASIQTLTPGSGFSSLVGGSGALLEQQVDAAATAADAVCTVDPNAEWVALMVTIR